MVCKIIMVLFMNIFIYNSAPILIWWNIKFIWKNDDLISKLPDGQFMTPIL